MNSNCKFPVFEAFMGVTSKRMVGVREGRKRGSFERFLYQD